MSSRVGFFGDGCCESLNMVDVFHCQFDRIRVIIVSTIQRAIDLTDAFDAVRIFKKTEINVADYLGIVIDQSFRDTTIFSHLSIVQKRQVGNWGFNLISVPESELGYVVSTLQDYMIDIRTDCWYAHFFSGNELVIVFQDKIFHCTTDRATWKDSIVYGISNGIPSEQLDFVPHTAEDAERFFA
jgi:hypothetical protein